MIEFAIAFAGLAIGFAIGRIEVFMNLRYETYKQRITEFYLPIYTLHIKTTKGMAYDFSHFPDETMKEMASIIIEKQWYSDKSLRDPIYEFTCMYSGFIDRAVKKSIQSGQISDAEVKEDEEWCDAINRAYRAISSQAFQECDMSMTRLLSPSIADLFRIAFGRNTNVVKKAENRNQAKSANENTGEKEEPFFPW